MNENEMNNQAAGQNSGQAISTSGSQRTLMDRPGRRKKLLVIVTLLVVIPLLTFLLKGPERQASEQNVTTGQSDKPDILLATVGDEKVYRSTVEAVAAEQYQKSAITDGVLKKFISTTIERKVLDREAKVFNIKKKEGQSNIEYYDEVKKQVLKGNVESVQAYVISYWVPPPDKYPQEPRFDELRRVGEQAMNEAELSIRNNEEPLVVAKDIYAKYLLLQPILGLNSTRLATTTDDAVFKEPQLFVFDARNAGQQFYDTLFSLQENEIRKSIWPDQSGGALFKVVKVNNANNVDYKDWLNKKIEEQVVFEQEAIDSL